MEVVDTSYTMGSRLVMGTFLWECDLRESAMVVPMGRWSLLVLAEAIIFNKKTNLQLGANFPEYFLQGCERPKRR